MDPGYSVCAIGHFVNGLELLGKPRVLLISEGELAPLPGIIAGLPCELDRGFYQNIVIAALPYHTIGETE